MNMRFLNLVFMTCVLFVACGSNLEQGKVDLSGGGANGGNNGSQNELTFPTKFVHPGLLHTESDILRWQEIIASQEGKAYQCWLDFSTDVRSQASYVMNGPYTEIYRGNDNGNRPSIQSKYENDFNAAYQNSIMYAVTKNEAHAVKAVAILSAYADKLQAIVAGDQPLLAGIMGVKFMYAAEMMRYLYPEGMTDEVFAKVCGMFRNIFVPVLDTFMKTSAYSNGNWGASVGMSYVAAAVLFDDLEMYKKGIEFYINGRDNGTIINYVDGTTGQCQESGRDQAHVQLGLACLSVTCEIAWNQGTDLYGYNDNRLMRGFEYTSKYNVGYDDLPFRTWKDLTGKYCNWTTISSQGRGQFRPVFEMPYNHYVRRKGLSMPYTKEVIDRISPEGYYYEHFGFGTFLFNDK